jgi:hypothetical protein
MSDGDEALKAERCRRSVSSNSGAACGAVGSEKATSSGMKWSSSVWVFQNGGEL